MRDKRAFQALYSDISITGLSLRRCCDRHDKGGTAGCHRLPNASDVSKTQQAIQETILSLKVELRSRSGDRNGGTAAIFKLCGGTCKSAAAYVQSRNGTKNYNFYGRGMFRPDIERHSLTIITV